MELSKHPGIAITIVIVLNFIFVMIPTMINDFVLIDDPIVHFLLRFAIRTILCLMVIPFVLHLPNGKESFREYLQSIRLTKFSPIGKNIAVTVVCVLCVLGGMFGAALIFGGWTSDLRRFDTRTAIGINSVLFALTHLTNLLVGQPIIIMLGQLIFVLIGAPLLCLLFIKTESLIPGIIVHYSIDALQPYLTYNLLQLGPNILVGGIFFLVGSAIGTFVAIAALQWLTKSQIGNE
jgi:membrane protease YdiL (CAAX protease family)